MSFCNRRPRLVGKLSRGCIYAVAKSQSPPCRDCDAGIGGNVVPRLALANLAGVCSLDAKLLVVAGVLRRGGASHSLRVMGVRSLCQGTARSSAEASQCQEQLQTKSDFPAIDVFITVCGEPIALVHDTIQDALRALTHYSAPVRIYVLDDFEPAGKDELPLALGLLCGELHEIGLPVFYINRKLDEHSDKSASKGGNLQNGFRLTEPVSPRAQTNSLGVDSGKYILMLDADGRVADSIFNRMVGLLECGDPRYGVVQAPQVYRNADPIAHALLRPGIARTSKRFSCATCSAIATLGVPLSPSAQDAWCDDRRSARSAVTPVPRSPRTWNSLFDCWKPAIAPFGSTKSWPTAPAPVNVTEFLKQRIRWCIGTLQHMWLPHGPLRGTFSMMERVLYADGVVYWLSYLLLPLMLLAPAVYLWTGASAIPVESDLVVPVIFGRVFLRAAIMWSISAGTLPPVVTTVWKSVVSFHISLAWLKALLWGASHPFKITRKVPNQGRLTFHWGVLAPSAATLLFTVAGCGWYLLDYSPAPALRIFDVIWTLWAMLICLLNCLVCIELPRPEDDEARCAYVERTSIRHLLRGILVRLFADPINVPSLHVARVKQDASREKSNTKPLANPSSLP